MDNKNIVQTTTRVMLTFETKSQCIYEAPQYVPERSLPRQELTAEIDAMMEMDIEPPTPRQLSPAQLAFYGNPELRRFIETGERPIFDVEALLADIPDEIIVG